MLDKIGNTIAGATQHLFKPQELAQTARTCGFMERVRRLDPAKLATSLICSLAGGKVDSIAGLLRCYNDDHGSAVDYRAFHDRLSSPHFSTFMLSLLEDAAKRLALSALDWSSSQPLRQFRDIVIQDGTSFALRDGLVDQFPGRFSAVSPAAVEIHVTMSLKQDTFTAATITPDSLSERNYLPSPETLRDCLLLADRGYDGIPYLSAVDSAGGFYNVRIRSIHDPIVESIESCLPKLKKLEGHHLSWVLSHLKKKRIWDLDVVFLLANGVRYPARLVLRWSFAANAWVRLVTNVARSVMIGAQVMSAYRLRWQIELLFKEFKSHSCLKKFQTNNRNIATGLIWASLLASFLKRFLSHTCQAAMSGQMVSTQKMAKVGHRFIRRIIAATQISLASVRDEILQMISFARQNCLRSRPKRDREEGRSFLKLCPAIQGA